MIMRKSKPFSWLVAVVVALLCASAFVDVTEAAGGRGRGGVERTSEVTLRNIPVVARVPHARILDELHDIGEFQHRGLRDIWMYGDRAGRRAAIEAMDAAVGMPISGLTDQEISARIGHLVLERQRKEEWTYSRSEYRDEDLQFLADEIIEAVHRTSGDELRELAREAFWDPHYAKVAIAKLMRRQPGDAYRAAIAIAMLPKDQMLQLIAEIRPNLQAYVVIEERKAPVVAVGNALPSQNGGYSPISGQRKRYDARSGGAYRRNWILVGRACTDQDRRDWRPGLRAPDEQFELLRGRDVHGAFFLVGEAYRFKFEHVASSAVAVTVHTACDDNGVLLLGEPRNVQLTQNRNGAQTCGRAARMRPRGDMRAAAMPTLICATDRDYSVGFKVVAN